MKWRIPCGFWPCNDVQYDVYKYDKQYVLFTFTLDRLLRENLTGYYVYIFNWILCVYVPCNLETSRSLQTARCSLQTARWPCSLQTACHAVCRLREGRSCTCVLWRDNFKENRENCHDFIVLYCVRNWEGISVVENLVRHNNRSFRANKLVIVSPNYKQENE